MSEELKPCPIRRIARQLDALAELQEPGALYGLLKHASRELLDSETAAENERLRAIVRQLPTDADGNRIAPGMMVDAKGCSGMYVEAVYANGEVFCSHKLLVQHSDMFDAKELRVSALAKAGTRGPND